MEKKRRFSLLLLLVFVVIGWMRLAGAAAIPEEAESYNKAGNEYCDKGEFEKGVEAFEKAVELYPNYTDALYNLGLTYYIDLKNYPKAVYYMKRFLELEGKTADSKQIQKWLDDAEQKVAAQPAQKESTAVAIVSNQEQPAEETSPLKETTGKEKTAKAKTEEKIPSPREKTVKPVTPPVPQVDKPLPVARNITPPPPPAVKTSPLPAKKRTAGEAESPKEEAEKYKNQGNEFNRLGKHEEAVKSYLKALQIYPEYTDALYNIAKTYDFDFKDYANATHYYKQFLRYESPRSRDAAQVKVWLGRVEKAYREQKEKAESKPTPYAEIKTASILKTRQSGKAEPPPREKKVGEFLSKGLLSSTSIRSGKQRIDQKGVPETVARSSVQEKKTAALPPPRQPVPAEKTAVQRTPAPVLPSLPARQLTDSQEIMIEAIIPRDLIGTKWASLGMQRMQQEIIEFLSQNKVKSPKKLAELYSSKIQSDILPSGEKVSYFRLGQEDVADLPYVSILSEEEKRALEKEKWELIKTRKSPARLREVLTDLRNGYTIIPH